MENFNGFTNYQTWNVKLWIDNTEELCNYWQAAAREAGSAGELAARLKDEIENGAPELEPSMYCDLLSSALELVNWLEIARELLEEVKA